MKPYDDAQPLSGRRNRRISGTGLSNGIWALPAIRLGFTYFGLSLPHTTSGRFNAVISRAPVPGLGRRLTD
jgi:hypothetical protein